MSAPQVYPNTLLIPRLGRATLVFSVQVAATSFFYGIYCVFFGMAIFALRQKGLSAPRMRFLLAALILMFLLATSVLGLVYALHFYPVAHLMLDLGAQENVDWISEYASLNQKLYYVDDAQYLTTMMEVFLADILVVARVWFLCRGNRIYHFLLVIPCIGSLGCIIAYIVAFSRGKRMDQTSSYWNLMPTLDLALSIFVNLTALWITLRQTWSYCKSTRKPFWNGRGNHSRIMRVMQILIQSGSLYILSWILFIVAFSPLHRPNLGSRILVTVLADIGGIVVAIYPCVLVVMLHNSAWKLEYTVDNMDNLEMPSLGTAVGQGQSTIRTNPHIVFASHELTLQQRSSRTTTDSFLPENKGLAL